MVMDSSCLSTTAGTPLKSGKIYSAYPYNDNSDHKQEEPLSPYMKAKREVARPKKPLSAYIYFS
jgi:hypothetical protein